MTNQPPAKSTRTLSSLPPEILHNIVDHIPNDKTLFALFRTCKQFSEYAAPRLYESVEFHEDWLVPLLTFKGINSKLSEHFRHTRTIVITLKPKGKHMIKIFHAEKVKRQSLLKVAAWFAGKFAGTGQIHEIIYNTGWWTEEDPYDTYDDPQLELHGSLHQLKPRVLDIAFDINVYDSIMAGDPEEAARNRSQLYEVEVFTLQWPTAGLSRKTFNDAIYKPWGISKLPEDYDYEFHSRLQTLLEDLGSRRLRRFRLWFQTTMVSFFSQLFPVTIPPAPRLKNLEFDKAALKDVTLKCGPFGRGFESLQEIDFAFCWDVGPFLEKLRAPAKPIVRKNQIKKLTIRFCSEFTALGAERIAGGLEELNFIGGVNYTPNMPSFAECAPKCRRLILIRAGVKDFKVHNAAGYHGELLGAGIRQHQQWSRLESVAVSVAPTIESFKQVATILAASGAPVRDIYFFVADVKDSNLTRTAVQSVVETFWRGEMTELLESCTGFTALRILVPNQPGV